MAQRIVLTSRQGGPVSPFRNTKTLSVGFRPLPQTTPIGGNTLRAQMEFMDSQREAIEKQRETIEQQQKLISIFEERIRQLQAGYP